MKKIIILFFIFILISQSNLALSLFTSDYNVSISSSANYNNKIFTHNVLAEYASLTTCPHCPFASKQLSDIYNSGDYDFYYVSLIYDPNKNLTWDRLDELGITSVPHVCFDGKFQEVKGSQSDEQPYRNAIENSGQRIVSEINLDVEVIWSGNGILKINIYVQNNGSEEFDGHLRAYVVEPVSRWNDEQGNPYRFGFLSFAFNRRISVLKQDIKSLGETYAYRTIWIGGLYGFKDISRDNIMVIAAIFDEENDYIQQTSAAIPNQNFYGKNISNIEFIDHGNITNMIKNFRYLLINNNIKSFF